ncbi:PAS domain-containing protein [Tropicimonas sp.]|uniref:PAS domain-containing protein n=1 Tax=Tropicimonas sp. TaxID=2067044 RepID=UPI003A8B4AAE
MHALVEAGKTMPDDNSQRPNVVFLHDDGDGKKFPAIRIVEGYWNELRQGRILPLRSDVDPRRIESALECTFMLERLAPGVARFRLAGMHLNDLMGMEISGMPLTSCFLPDARPQIGRVLDQVFDRPAAALLTLAGDRGIGKPPLDARMLLLPLAGDRGETSRVLGCLATLGPVGRTPRRFGMRDTGIVALSAPRDGAAAIGPVESPHAIAGFAEAQQGFTHPGPPRPPRGKPHLYVVKPDDA